MGRKKLKKKIEVSVPLVVSWEDKVIQWYGMLLDEKQRKEFWQEYQNRIFWSLTGVLLLVALVYVGISSYRGSVQKESFFQGQAMGQLSRSQFSRAYTLFASKKDDPVSQYYAAISLANMNQYEEAQVLLSKQIDSLKDAWLKSQAYLSLAKIEQAMGKTTQALKTLGQGLQKLPPKSPMAQVFQAEKAVWESELSGKEAIKDWKLVTAYDTSTFWGQMALYHLNEIEEEKSPSEALSHPLEF